MKLFNFFIKNSKPQRTGRFSEFLLTASKQEKEKVFKEAAIRANEEQQKVYAESRLKTKAS